MYSVPSASHCAVSSQTSPLSNLAQYTHESIIGLTFAFLMGSPRASRFYPHCSTCKGVAARKHEGGIDVIFTCFPHRQNDVDAKERGGDLIIRIVGELISKPVSCERAPAHHSFVILTSIVNIIKVLCSGVLGMSRSGKSSGVVSGPNLS